MNDIGSAFSLILQAAGGDQTTSMLMQIVPIVGIVAIFYFLLIRPQNKKQKETQKMIAAAGKGDKVVTIGGVHGVITSTKENSVIVKVDDNCKIEFSRSAIAQVLHANEVAEPVSSDSIVQPK